jgi:hypothetical protein
LVRALEAGDARVEGSTAAVLVFWNSFDLSPPG